MTKLVDRLLASPEYGERWGRHWLDVARYADAKGYVDAGEPKYPFAYTYRDYVVRAFNEDLPYDQFVREQIAADLLGTKDSQSLAALGFLTVGSRYNFFPHEIIDDRIDVVTRGLLGLTAACARCHDHKYDPIRPRTTIRFTASSRVHESLHRINGRNSPTKPAARMPSFKPSSRRVPKNTGLSAPSCGNRFSTNSEPGLATTCGTSSNQHRPIGRRPSR